MSAAKITISIAKSRQRKDGTYPIILRLSFKKLSREIKTGYSVPLADWDKKKRRVRSTYKGVSSVTRLNRKLEKKKIEFEETIENLEEAGTLSNLSIQELKNLLTVSPDQVSEESNPTSYFTINDNHIEGLRRANRHGSARMYYSVGSAIRTYCNLLGKSDLLLSEITYEFLLEFEYHHLGKGNSINGFAVYMRHVRALYNHAIKQGLADPSDNPFVKYRIKKKPTEKRAITLAQMKAIRDLTLSENSPLFHYRNYFLCSYYLCGISFIDLAFLKVDDIVGEHIRYQRKKTHEPFKIYILPDFKAILEYYTAGKNDTEFIFPIIKRSTLEEQRKDVWWARKRYNNGLKEIGVMAGIPQKITSYVVRHTWATIAHYDKKLSVKEVSDLLGHSDISTTEIYLKELSQTNRDSNVRLVGGLAGWTNQRY